MGALIDGAWRDGELPQETGAGGEFRRADSRFRDRVTADGSSGFKAEPGRYHLYVAHGCPWGHRTLIYRSVKMVTTAITVAYSIPGLRQQGWTFEADPATRHRERLSLPASGLYRLKMLSDDSEGSPGA
jgi:putative glutathione S-transferase